MTTPLAASISRALGYLQQEGHEIPLDIQLRCLQYGILRSAAKAATDLSAVNAVYHDSITESLISFFEGGNLTASRNQFKRATSTAFLDSFEIGYKDAGGSLPLSEDALAWLDARINTEWGFVGQLYEQAKELRKQGDFNLEWVSSKADAYTQTLNDIANNGKLRGAGNLMLTFAGEDGQPDNICQSTNGTCVKLKGQRHKASWWLAHDLVPYRGNPNYDCGAWECQHFLQTDNGERFTLSANESQAMKSYNPDQPRVPAGDSNGGQWTSDGTSAPLGYSEWSKETFGKEYPREGIFAGQYNRYVSEFVPQEIKQDKPKTKLSKKKAKTYKDFKDRVNNFIDYENENGLRYQYYGVRFEDKERSIGDSVGYSMHNPDRADERNFPAYGTPEYYTMQELGGASAWNIDMDGNSNEWQNAIMSSSDKDSDKISQGGHAYIIAGDANATHSDADPNEIVIGGAVVVAIIY